MGLIGSERRIPYLKCNGTACALSARWGPIERRISGTPLGSPGFLALTQTQCGVGQIKVAEVLPTARVRGELIFGAVDLLGHGALK
jgi:hypothetical protein